ncbi:tryptophan 2,3-dioxygenase [Lentinula guzmanii]|uniref:Tryptophan 2,3-dioxygenase n=1 Tax=Lentinula guzmanii TaxID=2804957 RepID=A0AA38MXN1_9AGAR|nr:tryptophan 2,3-dioxygenase [Lentinula guzmanii]
MKSEVGLESEVGSSATSYSITGMQFVDDDNDDDSNIDNDDNSNLDNISTTLPSSHFLSLPRPSSSSLSWTPNPNPPPTPNPTPSPSHAHAPPPPPIVDTTTLAAHDFDVDPRTGFMPPHPPLPHLPPSLEGERYAEWETTLRVACESRLQLAVDTQGEGGGGGRGDAERRSEEWRGRVRKLPILSITPLLKSEVLLRRGHHVLAWILHFYIHTYPLHTPSIPIPPPLTLPLLQISHELQLPPVLTYSDDVLYNWGVLTSFTGTPSESHFYLTSARIELIGVRALEVMQSMLDELFVGDEIAVRRITRYLGELGEVIGEMERELRGMREGCVPEVFYNQIRPWFRGFDSIHPQRPWVFQGIDGIGLDAPPNPLPTHLSGPSAGQSSLIHALDIFLGVRHAEGEEEVLRKMRAYMPRHHRRFLAHLKESTRSLRGLVAGNDEGNGEGQEGGGEGGQGEGNEEKEGNDEGQEGEGEEEEEGKKMLVEAYNQAVGALRKLRDAHFGIVARYIIGPAASASAKVASAANSSAAAASADANAAVTSADDANVNVNADAATEGGGEGLRSRLKGTGGTDLARFLKSVRDDTKEAVISSK